MNRHYARLREPRQVDRWQRRSTFDERVQVVVDPVLFGTEFGRTVQINGTSGTDHGTATVALLAGGALKGGRVIADWPGLKTANLYEGRDLRPTTDLHAVLKGVLRDHLMIGESALTADVFPGSARIRPIDGLLAWSDFCLLIRRG